METTDVMLTVTHSTNLNLDKEKVAVVDVEYNSDEGSNSDNIMNGPDKPNDDEDQDSVIIQEVVTKIIDLNEDSEEEIELEIVQNASDLPILSKNSPAKTTEFVIVNAANLSNPVINVTDAAVGDMQIKDELSEAITADLNVNDVLENDPMDLLELNHRSESSSSIRSPDETDYADDGSSIGSSSIQTGSSSSVSVHDWIKDYPWLLYEEGDDQLGYCLYCDVKINTKSQRSVKQHGISLYHQERCDNYLAFREEEEKNGFGMQLVEIKEEFGTDSRVEALKLKRKSQSVALNNFNWRRWLGDCPWLERDCAEGTIGLCKYCQVHVNVEFSYLRDRHQEGTKHREAEKQHGSSTETKDSNKTAKTNEKESTAENSSSKTYRWLEILEKEPTMARCKICGIKILKNNFLRHLTTKVHEHNEKIYLQNQKTNNQNDFDENAAKTQPHWEIFATAHPWIISDPENPAFAYCKYCDKRMIYGTSASKRATHENSLQHKTNEIEFKKRSRNFRSDKKQNPTDDTGGGNAQNENESRASEEEKRDDDENTEEKDDGDDEEQNESDDENDKDNEEDEDEDNAGEKEQEAKESENETESKKRPKVLTEEWLKQYSWCKKYKKDPKNFIFCIYCRTPLRPNSRKKHQNSSVHKSAQREFLDQQAKKQKLEDKKPGSESLPFFEWAVPLKNNTSSYSCRYCRVRISKNYSKKQHAASKIHQINESIYKNNRRKPLRNDESNTDTSQPSPEANKHHPDIGTKPAFGKVVFKAPTTLTLIKQHQKKFPWLTYKQSELRTHYGYCKICDSSVYIRSVKHISRHTRSGRHMRILKAKKRQKVEKDEGSEASEQIIKPVSKEELETSPPTVAEREGSTWQPLEYQKGFNYKSTITEMKKRYSWIESSDKPNYAFCPFCNANIPLKILFLRNHSNSAKHRHSVINSYSIEGGKNTRQKITGVDNDATKSGDAGNDVFIVDHNNEEILISEQDENWTVKSETMDEHEELDYLLQRSFDHSSNVQRNVRKSVHVADGPQAKRVKRSHSFRRLTDSNSSLVASLLTTPLTLASCLGPLIQQQIQQANLSQVQTSSPTATAVGAAKSTSMQLAEPENTYDLFFKSVSETMKKLPVDLAAEGKLRVMQVLCDLELQALKRDHSESVSSNYSGVSNYQATPTTTLTNASSNSRLINDISPGQNGNVNELSVNTDNSPPSTSNVTSSKVANSNPTETPASSCASSPVIGVMDKNGMQTLQLKAGVPNQITRNATSTITTVSNSGIRCIPFKNLSQPVAADVSNQKIARIQGPINVPQQCSTQNLNTVNTSKNLINFRNIQITKRIGTPPTSVTPTTIPQQTMQKPTSIANSSPRRSYITNIQPQLQRWGCSVNGSTSQQTPTSTTVTHQQLSSQGTSTPISRK